MESSIFMHADDSVGRERVPQQLLPESFCNKRMGRAIPPAVDEQVFVSVMQKTLFTIFSFECMRHSPDTFTKAVEESKPIVETDRFITFASIAHTINPEDVLSPGQKVGTLRPPITDC
jgi:hypothetical protein